MAQEYFEQVRDFIEKKPVVQKATKHLRKGAVVGFTVEGDPSPYYVETLEKGVCQVRKGAPASPDIDLVVTPRAMDHLLSFETDSLGTLGVEFLKLMASKEPDFDIRITTIHAGFLAFAAKGYFSVVAAAGPGVLGFLAKKGLGNPAGMKKAIQKRRKG